MLIIINKTSNKLIIINNKILNLKFKNTRMNQIKNDNFYQKNKKTFI